MLRLRPRYASHLLRFIAAPGRCLMLARFVSTQLQGNGGKGTDPPGIPLTALLGPYARKRKPKKKAAPVEPKTKRTSKTSKPAEGGATTQDLMRDTGKGSEGTMTLGATLSPGSMTGVMGLATVHFDVRALAV